MRDLKSGYVIERYQEGDIEIEIEAPAEIAHQMLELQVHLIRGDVPTLCEYHGIVYWKYPGGLQYPIAPIGGFLSD